MLSSGAIKRGIKLTLLFLFLPILMASSVNNFDTRIDPNYISDAPSGYGEPSPMAKKVGILVTSTGISKQVQDNYNVTLGDTVNISADGERTPFDVASGGLKSAFDYQWSMVTSNKTWNAIEGAKSNTLKFTPHQEGTYWFQLKITYYIQNLLNPFSPYQNNMYTKVAKVNVTKNKIKVDSIDIKTSSDYIYNKRNFFNDNSTYASATIKPTNSTEQVKWSLVQNDKLAEISDNGQIKANLVSDEDNHSGEIEVHATANHDLQETELAHTTKKIKVGGGLLDTHVSIGNSALFKIQGMGTTSNVYNDNIKITWQRKRKNSNDLQDVSNLNKSNNKYSFEVPDISFADDGDLYQATIKASINNKEHSYTTNFAKINVNPTDDPNISFKAEINNGTRNDRLTAFSKSGSKTTLECTLPRDTSHNLYKIMPNDELNYIFDITNNSKNIIESSEIIFEFPRSTSENIIVDNNDLFYNIDTEKNLKRIHISVISLGPKKSAHVEVHLFGPVDNQNITFQPTYISNYKSGENHITKSPQFTLNYISNKIEFHPKNIFFESISPLDNNSLKHRTYPSETDTPIDIDDQRCDKSKKARLYLKQTTDFINPKRDVLPFDLLFYDPNNINDPQNIKSKTLISSSKENQAFEPVHWDRNHGILLHLNRNSNLKTGNYQAEISWIMEDSITN